MFINRHKLLLPALAAMFLTALLFGQQSDEEIAHPQRPAEASTYVRPPNPVIKSVLTDLQYAVTQNGATEPPFDNRYWDNTREGIYVDIVTGEPLFSSTDKYEAGTGWPSFTQPIHRQAVVTRRDYSFILPQTEVRSQYGDSHLGHVFKDGPKPHGLRYCMNSAALRFVPKEHLASQGYGKYLTIFQK